MTKMGKFIDYGTSLHRVRKAKNNLHGLPQTQGHDQRAMQQMYTLNVKRSYYSLEVMILLPLF